MIGRMRLLITLMLCAASIGHAQNTANQFNGAQLKSSCEASVERAAGIPISLDQMVAATRCQSYVAGFIESTVFSVGSGAKPLFCIPSTGLSAADAAITVHAFATLHPGMLEIPAAAFVAASLGERFPCPDEAPGTN